jgi:hypothetical protein
VAADQNTALGTLLGVAPRITANPRHARGNRDGLREGLAGADRLAAVPVREHPECTGDPYAFSYQERRYPVPARSAGAFRPPSLTCRVRGPDLASEFSDQHEKGGRLASLPDSGRRDPARPLAAVLVCSARRWGSSTHSPGGLPAGSEAEVRGQH